MRHLKTSIWHLYKISNNNLNKELRLVTLVLKSVWRSLLKAKVNQEEHGYYLRADFKNYGLPTHYFLQIGTGKYPG